MRPSQLNILWSLLTLQSKNCPYCESRNTNYLSKTGKLSQVRECIDCKLLYRYPKQDEKFNKIFYQTAYSKAHQTTVTLLPSKEELSYLKETKFKGTEKDYAPYVALLKTLGISSVLDFGCSWGYGVYQFLSAGLESQGLEISEPRAAFGRKNLGVTISKNLEQLQSCLFDAVFSAHVLEHFPNPRLALEQWEKLVRPGGLLILEVPNCGGTEALAHGVRWGPFSSVLHPLSITQAFLTEVLPRHGFRPILFPERPQTEEGAREIAEHVQSGGELGTCSGDALVCIARRE